MDPAVAWELPPAIANEVGSLPLSPCVPLWWIDVHGRQSKNDTKTPWNSLVLI